MTTALEVSDRSGFEQISLELRTRPPATLRGLAGRRWMSSFRRRVPTPAPQGGKSPSPAAVMNTAGSAYRQCRGPRAFRRDRTSPTKPKRAQSSLGRSSGWHNRRPTSGNVRLPTTALRANLANDQVHAPGAFAVDFKTGVAARSRGYAASRRKVTNRSHFLSASSHASSLASSSDTSGPTTATSSSAELNCCGIPCTIAARLSHAIG